MIEIVFASGNHHKLEEIAAIMPEGVNLVSMRDLGFQDEIDEYGTTLEQNARIKAAFIAERFGKNCFADDTGLEVEALDGAPGVYSARYAGENCSFEDNVQKLLTKMGDATNRRAAFRTVIHLFWKNEEYVFEGKVEGTITTTPQGQKGFGYDPVFIPDGDTRSFAEMTLEEKSKVSHRAKAVEKLRIFLEEELTS